MPDLSKGADGLADNERHQPTTQAEAVPEETVTGASIAAHEPGTAQPSSQPEVAAPDTQHLTPGVVPVANSLGYLPHHAAVFATRPAVPEPDPNMTMAEQAENPTNADGDAHAAAGTVANHYSQEGDKHDPRDPDLVQAESKVNGTVPIAQMDQTFTKDATPDHELSDPKPGNVPHPVEHDKGGEPQAK